MPDEVGNVAKIGNWIAGFLLGDTRERIARIDERTLLMSKDLDEIRPKVSDMTPKVDILWKDKYAPSRSPRKLNDRGNAVLLESGIKEIIDQKRDSLLSEVHQKKATNPYDAEKIIFDIVAGLKQDQVLVENLKNGAFATGTDIETVLLVGGLYFRDLIFPDLGFSVEDLDQPKNI